MGRLPLSCHQAIYLQHQVSTPSETEVRAECQLPFYLAKLSCLNVKGGNSVKAHCSAAGDVIIQQEVMLGIQPRDRRYSSHHLESMHKSGAVFHPQLHPCCRNLHRDIYLGVQLDSQCLQGLRALIGSFPSLNFMGRGILISRLSCTEQIRFCSVP